VRAARAHATHRAHEALPAELAAERLDGLHALAERAAAARALGQAEVDVAALAVRVALVDREADVLVRKRAIARERARARARTRRRQERVAALGAEEVLLVVRARAERGVVERDVRLVDDRRLAVVAVRREQLCGQRKRVFPAAHSGVPHGSRGGSTAGPRARNC
jgi:hypothetical protein